ncbi:MAG: adenine phosphoribosyltransferase [Planctomycetaceae bacterium]|jgi:adenine phosphoribosyltransferase|nr:adenine phosphoribosyltransferase [Planctomycetaceae bacterium]
MFRTALAFCTLHAKISGLDSSYDFSQKTMIDLAAHIRTIPDFPIPGILFYDITTLIQNGGAFQETVDRLADSVRAWGKIDLIAAPEARGFIFAAPLAVKLGVGLIPIRKPGKLPFKTVSKSYELEYGTNTIQINCDAVKTGDRVLLLDDLLATGGTIEACRQIVTELGGSVVGAAFVMELIALKGREKIKTPHIETLLQFA